MSRASGSGALLITAWEGATASLPRMLMKRAAASAIDHYLNINNLGDRAVPKAPRGKGEFEDNAKLEAAFEASQVQPTQYPVASYRGGNLTSFLHQQKRAGN